jgi:hypothetical protein
MPARCHCNEKSCVLTGLTEDFPNRFLVTLNWTNRLIHAGLKSFLVARIIVLKYSTSYEYLNSGLKNADQNTDEYKAYSHLPDIALKYAF